jgi:hypothetical protein
VVNFVEKLTPALMAGELAVRSKLVAALTKRGLMFSRLLA